jgi:hypothetical protein
VFHLVGGQEVYSMPDDFMEFQSLEEPITIGGVALDLKPEGVIEQDRGSEWSTANSDPAWFYYKGVDVDPGSADFGRMRVGFYPVPAQNMDAIMPYMRLPVNLDVVPEGVDYPDLPSSYCHAVAYWAAVSFFDRQTERPAKDVGGWLERFEAAAIRLRRETNEQFSRLNRVKTPDFTEGMIEDWMEV